jgi:hypothetical protein
MCLITNLISKYCENRAKLSHYGIQLFDTGLCASGVLQPKRLFSPTAVMEKQMGNCFEYSTLLCSFLIGSGYDAYVVSGYATREFCLFDQTRIVCPYLPDFTKVK